MVPYMNFYPFYPQSFVGTPSNIAQPMFSPVAFSGDLPTGNSFTSASDNSNLFGSMNMNYMQAMSNTPFPFSPYTMNLNQIMNSMYGTYPQTGLTFTGLPTSSGTGHSLEAPAPDFLSSMQPNTSALPWNVQYAASN
jgi:hypothetical protein